MRVWIKRVNKNSDRRFQYTDICWDTENMLSVLARRVVEQIQMKMTRPIGKILAGLCFMGLIASCDSSKENQLNVKHRESYHINPEVTTNGISTAQYSVDSVCSLQVSDDIVEIRTSKIIAANGRIYLLDAEITKKLYVFDSKGNLTATIGERGRARNEFVGKPDDFFVDSKNRLHVFDKIGHKIIVYDGNGAFRDVIMTDAYYPHSIGLTGTDKYMMMSVRETKAWRGMFLPRYCCSTKISRNTRSLCRRRETYTALFLNSPSSGMARGSRTSPVFPIL